MKKLLLVGVLLCVGILAFAGGKKEKFEPKVTTYVRTWPLGLDAEQDNGRYWTANDIHAQYLNEVILSFGLINQDDLVSIEFKNMKDSPSDFTEGKIVKGNPDLFKSVTALKKKYPHLKVNMSVGGWGAQFSDTMNDPDLRAKFIENAIKIVKDNNLDGVDIDWEYPVGPDWGQEIKSRPEDADNFISILTELRAALDDLAKSTKKAYGMSACIPAQNWYTDKIDVATAAGIVDSLKFMAYDYYGPWSSTTGHGANLFTAEGDPAWGGISSDMFVEKYLAAGVPAAKLMLGVSFYAHAWEGVEPGERNGLFQPFTAKSPLNDAAYDKIAPLLKSGSGYTRYWDDVAKAPYLYDGNTFITYTDQEAIKNLAQYAKDKGLGGVFVWEYAHDMGNVLLKALNDSMQ